MNEGAFPRGHLLDSNHFKPILKHWNCWTKLKDRTSLFSNYYRIEKGCLGMKLPCDIEKHCHAETSPIPGSPNLANSITQ